MRTCGFHTALGEFIGFLKATGGSRVQGPAFNIIILIIIITTIQRDNSYTYTKLTQ